LGNITGILGGDIKVETSVELRTTLLRNILAANWIGATFLDVGNVWFGPRNQGFGRVPDGGDGEPAPPALPADRNGRLRNVSSLSEVGVGSGVGLRIEWEYLIVRFDLAYRLHDPSPQNDDVFSDTYTGPLLHFGIGQAF
jgi:outer membrane protein assembly factor BamA